MCVTSHEEPALAATVDRDGDFVVAPRQVGFQQFDVGAVVVGNQNEFVFPLCGRHLFFGYPIEFDHFVAQTLAHRNENFLGFIAFLIFLRIQFLEAG